jgi:4-amino-4-deoxy-L-arabinose transferase-like glycosyltransferase
MWAVLGVTAAALAAHDVAFGWVVRCGAGLPLAFALAYSVGRLMSDRKQSYAGLAAVIAIQFLVLAWDSAAGLPIIPFTAVISAAFWGAGLYVQKRAQRGVVHAAAPVETFA